MLTYELKRRLQASKEVLIAYENLAKHYYLVDGNGALKKINLNRKLETQLLINKIIS